MKFVLSVVLFLWILAAGRADEFFLTNAVTGEKFGPFQFREGERLSLGKQTLIIAKVLTPKQKIEEKLKLTHIPEMDLRQASIDDVVDFLQAASKEFDPADSLSLKQGVQFVLNLPKTKQESPPKDADRDKILITFSVRNISLYDALRMICKFANLRHTVDEAGVVVIEPNQVQPKTGDSTKPAPQ